MLQVRCPKCKHKMLCNPIGSTNVGLGKKRKKCVYCGKSFKILGNILKKV